MGLVLGARLRTSPHPDYFAMTERPIHAYSRSIFVLECLRVDIIILNIKQHSSLYKSHCMDPHPPLSLYRIWVWALAPASGLRPSPAAQVLWPSAPFTCIPCPDLHPSVFTRWYYHPEWKTTLQSISIALHGPPPPLSLL